MFLVKVRNGAYVLFIANNKMMYIRITESLITVDIVEALISFVVRHRKEPAVIYCNDHNFFVLANKYGTKLKYKAATYPTKINWAGLFAVLPKQVKFQYKKTDYDLQGDMGYLPLETKTTQELTSVATSSTRKIHTGSDGRALCGKRKEEGINLVNAGEFSSVEIARRCNVCNNSVTQPEKEKAMSVKKKMHLSLHEGLEETLCGRSFEYLTITVDQAETCQRPICKVCLKNVPSSSPTTVEEIRSSIREVVLVKNPEDKIFMEAIDHNGEPIQTISCLRRHSTWKGFMRNQAKKIQEVANIRVTVNEDTTTVLKRDPEASYGWK